MVLLRLQTLMVAAAFLAADPIDQVFDRGFPSAQAAEGDELATEIKALAKKLKDYSGDSRPLADAISTIDPQLERLRDEGVSVKLWTAGLTRWIETRRTPAERLAAWTAVLPLVRIAIKLAEPLPQTQELVLQLTRALDLAFTLSEIKALQKDLTDLGKGLDALVKERSLIHIIRATYGHHSTGRTCDATNYFRGACEGKAKCPDDTITGDVACGYEPAPYAPKGSSTARVTYKCIGFRFRSWEDIQKQESSTDLPEIELYSKAKILCDPR